MSRFCGFQTNGLFITDKSIKSIPGLRYAPCCWHGSNYSEIDRSSWTTDDWTDPCSYCLQQESDGRNSSMRMFANDLVAGISIDDHRPVYLVIDYSNACNGACGMCNSMSSSTIAKIMRQERSNNVRVPNVKQQDFFDAISKIDYSNIKMIRFRGGEPLYVDFHKKVLDMMPDPSKIEVIYTTNGTIYPDQEWIDIAKRFKKIRFSISVDGVRDKFDYIRTKLSWQVFDENVRKLIAIPGLNISSNLECTVSPVNLYYYDEVFKYLLELKSINKSMDLRWHACHDDWDLSNATPNLRTLFSDKYGSNFYISKVLGTLPFDSDKYQMFVNSVDAHERRFDLDGSNVFPEVWKTIIDRDMVRSMT